MVSTMSFSRRYSGPTVVIVSMIDRTAVSSVTAMKQISVLEMRSGMLVYCTPPISWTGSPRAAVRL